LLDIQVERPWGYFKKFCENSPVTVKLIVVKPKEILSLQSHAKRAEFWCIIDGSGRAEIGTEIYKLKKQMELVVPKKTKHRLAAGINGLKVLEISFGDFSEDDIVRYQDKYGRI
jgi:mannose-1-phosphate guanylyltransferase/mannose-6-phosphate isomerase